VAADEEPDRLYGLPLEDFVRERDALAKRMRADGRREDAAAVKALGKPTVAAWAVDQAVRARPREAEALWAAGDALAAAQAALLAGEGDAASLRSAGQAEQAALQPLLDAARGLLTGGGRSLGEDVLERVEETLHAAAVDAEARPDVAAGRLTRELRHAGLGLAPGGAAPPAKPKASRRSSGQAERAGGGGAGSAAKAGSARPSGRAERAAADAAAERERRVAGARRAVREAEAALARARDEAAEADRAASRAAQRLESARRAEAEARRAAQAARREERDRAGALERAQAALRRAEG
jgi:hypothetical protein